MVECGGGGEEGSFECSINSQKPSLQESTKFPVVLYVMCFTTFFITYWHIIYLAFFRWEKWMFAGAPTWNFLTVMLTPLSLSLALLSTQYSISSR